MRPFRMETGGIGSASGGSIGFWIRCEKLPREKYRQRLDELKARMDREIMDQDSIDPGDNGLALDSGRSRISFQYWDNHRRGKMGRRIERIRAHFHWSYEDLARHLGLYDYRGANRVRAWEKEIVRPNRVHWKQLLELEASVNAEQRARGKQSITEWTKRIAEAQPIDVRRNEYKRWVPNEEENKQLMEIVRAERCRKAETLEDKPFTMAPMGHSDGGMGLEMEMIFEEREDRRIGSRIEAGFALMANIEE